MAFQKTLVRSPYQFSKNAFPSIPHNRFAKPTPNHDSNPGIPQAGRTGNHVEVSRRDALTFPFYSLEVLFFFQEYRRAP